MAFTRSTVSTTNISELPDRPTISATALKAAFDKYGADDKPYINDTLLPELEDSTAGGSGAESIGSAPISGVAGTTVHAQLSSIATSDSNSVKLTGDQSVAGVKTFTSSPIVPTPTTDTQVANRKFVTDSVMDIEVGVLPEGAVSNAYLGADVKVGSNASLNTNVKDTVSGAINSITELPWDIEFTRDSNGKITLITSTLDAATQKTVSFTRDSNGKTSQIVTVQNSVTTTATFNRGGDGKVNTITKVVTE